MKTLKITMKTLPYNLLRLRRILFTLHAFPHLCTFVSFCLCGDKLKMQNEPNFQKTASTLNAVIAETYNKYPSWKSAKTNPIEANTNPISKRSKFNANFCHNKDLQRKTPLAGQKIEPDPNPIQTQFTSRKSSHPPFTISHFTSSLQLYHQARFQIEYQICLENSNFLW